MSGVEVLRPGPLTTVQDLGRPGLAHLGVPRSGAADPVSLRGANLLVGNADRAAALETTLRGPALRFGAPALVALAGAPAPVTLDGRPVPFGVALEIAAGAVLDVGAARSGVRTYLAVAGGIDAVPVLGSRSRDTLTGLGPAPLSRGDVVAIGGEDALRGRADLPGEEDPPGEAVLPGEADPPGDADLPTEADLPSEQRLRVLLGPREDRFTAAGIASLTAARFTVAPASNRIGVRLEGPAIEQLAGDELPSEGLVRGAVQVPASGNPIVMLADHPTTGGYPVIAVVAERDLGLLGQLRPGTAARFTLVG